MKHKKRLFLPFFLSTMVFLASLLTSFSPHHNRSFSFKQEVLSLAKSNIETCRDEVLGYGYYHWNLEETVGHKWNFYQYWIDDVFYMSFGGVDVENFGNTLLTFHNYSLRFGYCPSILNLQTPEQSNFRTYGAFLYPIMVWNYYRFSENPQPLVDYLKPSVIANCELMLNFLKDDLVFYTKTEAGLPDWVFKNGYITDLTMYLLLGLRILQQLYGINTDTLYNKIQTALLEKMWNEELGFFSDWVDVDGNRHDIFAMEQLISIMFDLIPDNYQRIMYDNLPKTLDFAGRFWFYRPYAIEEMTTVSPDWNYANKVIALYFYLFAINKFSSNSNFRSLALSLYQDALEDYGFCDFYHWVPQKYVVACGEGMNYISNSGCWIALYNLFGDY